MKTKDKTSKAKQLSGLSTSLADCDQSFCREVEKGLAAADRDEFIEHEDIRKLIDRRYPG